jgi:uncharacterized protein (UPF0332 family)
MDKLERCFQGTRESPPRLIQKEPDVNTAQEHLEKAEHNLLAMELMLQNKFFDWTIVTSYYAMYHATLAALWLIGIDARSHECAVLAFESFYAKKGKVDKKYVEYLHRAKNLSEKYAETLEKIRTLRVQASYGIGEIKSVDAIFASSQAKDFVGAIRKLVSEAKGFGYTKV